MAQGDPVDESAPGPSVPTKHVEPAKVLYCSVCSYPPEYCEFGASLSKCKAWLEDAHPDLFDKYYSEDALKSKMGTLSLDKQEKLEADTAKAEAKAAKKAEKAENAKAASKVTIKRSERNKRKFITSIHGLETFGVDLKKAAKLFAGKFATGSSVSKNPQGLDEIVVQGDVTEEIIDMIVDQIGVLKGVPEAAIVKVEEKKKKVEPPKIAEQPQPNRG